jgi:hypothetical protein
MQIRSAVIFDIRNSLIDLLVRRKKICFAIPKRNNIPVLISAFLIISSSIYPAIISSTENAEYLITAKVLAQLDEKRVGGIKGDTVDTSAYHASFILSNSPTPIVQSPLLWSLPQISDNNASTHDSKVSSITSSESETASMMREPDNDTVYAVAEGDIVPVVWADTTPGGSDIFERRSLNAGSTFPNIINNLSDDPTGSFFPAIDTSDFTASDIVHVVWQGEVSGNIEILYRRSLDGGATFGPTINVSNTPGGSFTPKIAVLDNFVHVVWRDTTPGNDEILYTRSVNGGDSFISQVKNLSGNADTSTSPAVAVADNNNVHVVWENGTSVEADILYRRSLNGGSTFPNIIKNLSSNVGSSTAPSIAVSENNVHVVWSDNTPSLGNVDILYRRSLNGGNTFPNIIKNISGSPGVSVVPAIAVLVNNVHIVWRDSADILYRKSLNGGNTFPNIIENISNNAGLSNLPTIAVSGSTVHVAWTDNTGLSGGNFDILYRRSTNNGADFQNTKNLSFNSGASVSPAIGVL